MPDGSRFTAIISAQLDTSGINEQLKNASKTWKANVRISKFTLDTRELSRDIQQALSGHSFTLKLTNVDVGSLSNTITGRVKDIGAQAGTSFSQSFTNQISARLGAGELDKSLSSVTAKFQSLKASLNGLNTNALSGDFHARFQQLEVDLTTLNTLKNQFANGKITQNQYWEAFNAVLTRVKNNLTIAANETRQFASSIEVATLQNRMEGWLTSNSRAAKTYGVEIQKLVARLKELSAQGNVEKVQLQEIAAEFNNVKVSAQAAGLTGKSFGSSLANAFKSITRYFGVATVVYRAIAALKQMYQNVLKIDTAMTGLRRVTNLTADEYEEMYNSMAESAKKYGAALSDIIDLTTSWVKLGFGTEEAKRLAEISTMYQHVADVDTSTATENLVTAYKGFQKTLDEEYGGDAAKSIEHVTDVYDKLNNEFAVTAANVGSALQRSASSLQIAGNTFEQSAGMATGITEVLQDPEKAGTTLNILSLRLRGMKGTLEELGEEVDENVESISKMQTHILNLTNGKVNIFDDTGQFRSTYDIMKDIAEIWDELDSKAQADLLETVSGKMRANAVSALITNWDQVEKATTAAYNSAGTAATENEKYLNSMQGKIDSTRASWQELSNTFLSSDFLKTLIDGAQIAFETLNKVVGTLGTIPTILLVIAARAAIKNFGRDKMFSLK